ncbi:MAG: DsbA family protein, partial [Nitrospirota bacterium]|nr:DsbA family protein [Nitrospirota bacterium]
SVMAAAEELGLDVERLRADMNAPEVEAHLQVTMQLSQALGINGTPAFVIGDELVPGAVGLDQLRQLVAKARDGG